MKAELRMRVKAICETLKIPFNKYASRVIGQREYRGGWGYGSGVGLQETARRRRQIARGQLTKSNGLVS